METTVKGSERLTNERRARRQKLTHKKLHCATPEVVAATADTGLLDLLIDFLAGKDPDNLVPSPPDELMERLTRIPDPCAFVALAILAPLLDRIERGWDDRSTFRDAWRTQLAEQMGERLRDEFARKEMKLAEEQKEELRGRRLKFGERRGRPSTHKFLHSDWTPTECVVAGDWLLDVAEWLPCFDYDENGRLCVVPGWQERIDKAREELLWRHPVWLPHRAPPKPWAGWWVNYGDRLRARFVRDWRPHARTAIEEKFAEARPPEKPSGPFAALADPAFYSDDANRLLPFAHADGVNALKAVPLRINQALLPLVDKFAVSVMRGDVKKLVDAAGRPLRRGDRLSEAFVVMGPDAKKLKADRRTVKADLRDARWCGKETFYLDYNCDKRGRLNAIQHLNYAREDHVRSLFEFARPAPLTADRMGGTEAMSWLEIHTANCWGEDKKPWRDRLRWANENTDLIERVAADPEGTFEHWGEKADKKFAFVAACLELSRARKNPEGFETRLPIGFDGTANGLQHLVLLSFDRRSHNLATERDWEAARLVNLIDGDAPQDIYLAVTQRIVELLKGEDDRLFTKVKGRVVPRREDYWEAFDRNWNSIGFFPDEASAKAAVKRLPKPQGKSVRDDWCFNFWRNRLSVMDEGEKRKLLKTPIMTLPYSSTVGGMAEEMVDVYSDLFELNEPEDDAAMFLAKAVRYACHDILPGPTRIMKYIRKLALHRYHEGEDKFLEWISPTGFPFVNMYHKPNFVKLDLTGGVRSRYKVADGASPKRRKIKMLNTASPNFIHSLDAAHLIRTVLTANREGIHDILTVHDSYSCLAPFARPFGQIIRREMAMLHAIDPLRALSKANGDPLPLPQRGNIDPLVAQSTEYSFM